MNRIPKFRKFLLVPLVAVAATAVLATSGGLKPSLAGSSAAAQSGAITSVTFPAIKRTAPPDVNYGHGGAGTATIADAAIFAWQEFIALNWPATPQTGALNTRGEPDKNARFGDDSKESNPADYDSGKLKPVDRPVVWETYRGKVETFPGVGYPPGYNIGGPSYGFDHAPQYVYGTRSTTPPTPLGGSPPTGSVQNNPGGTPLDVPPCNGQAKVSNPALINLDEITQIADDSMFAGIVPSKGSAVNAQPQLIRFLAKGNRTFYDYVAGHQYWYQGKAFNTAENYFANAAQNNTYPPKGPTIDLPPGTILVKAAWRVLAPSESAADFHTKTVRYYENNGSTTEPACYREQIWALIGLHIIQKTPTAPYFIYATFEHANNILTPDGKPVEDKNGALNPNAPKNATTPTLQYFDADGKYYGPDYPKGNPQPPAPPLGAASPVVVIPAGGCHLSVPLNTNSKTVSVLNEEIYYRNLIYLNSNAPPPLPTPGEAVCVNKRYFQVPAQIVAVNQAAHTALASYGAPSLWQNYKLVDVQWQPFNVTDIDTSGGDTRRLAAIYYQSNSVIETDNGLQQFFGNPLYGFTNLFYLKSYYRNGDPKQGPAYDIFLPPGLGTPKGFTRLNMGGCMGCHGNAEKGGTDFSFTLAGGPVAQPEFPIVGPDNKETGQGFDLARIAKLHYAQGVKSP